MRPPGWLTGAPSTSTFVWFELPPSRKNDVSPPSGPARPMLKPGCVASKSGSRYRDALVDFLARQNRDRSGRGLGVERKGLRGDDDFRGERLERHANFELARFSRRDCDFLLDLRERNRA